jgi:hypothetical protein
MQTKCHARITRPQSGGQTLVGAKEGTCYCSAGSKGLRVPLPDLTVASFEEVPRGFLMIGVLLRRRVPTGDTEDRKKFESTAEKAQYYDQDGEHRCRGQK